MPPEAKPLTAWSLLKAGLRRSPRRTAVGFAVALVAAGALLGATWLLRSMDESLAFALQRLGADMILAPRGSRVVVEQLLNTGTTTPLPATINVAEWKQRLRTAKVDGIRSVQGWSLQQGGAGKFAPATASVVLVRLESYVSPLIATLEVGQAIPEAELVVAEEAARQVTRNLQLLVRLMTMGAGVALFASILMTGLLTSVRVAERRAELGMLRAVGATRSFLLGLVLAETGIPALAGGLVGMAVTAGWLMAGPGVGSVAKLLLFGLGSALAVTAVAVVSALPPAVRTAWMDPLEAVRRAG
ncbi:MAG TPA: ABC transporter permease [Symbiobacteriaceae bacterium]|jgi:putative ABC transport system permease protein